MAVGAGVLTALALAAVAVAALVLARGTDAGAVVEPDSLVKIDVRTNEIIDVVGIGRDPGQVAIVGKHIFVTSERDQTLHRVDLRSGGVTVSGAFAAGGALAGAGRFLWVVSEKRAEVVQTDAESLLPVQRIPLRQGLARAFVALGGGSLWVSVSISDYTPGAISRYRLRTLQLERRLPLGTAYFAVPSEIIYADGAAWVVLEPSNELLRIDDLTGLTTRSPVGSRPAGLVFGFGSIWVGSAGDRAVWRVNPDSERTIAIIRAGRVEFGLAVGAGSVWVANHCDGSVSRIDPRANSVVATIETGYFPKWLAVGRGFAWVGVSGTEVAGSCD